MDSVLGADRMSSFGDFIALSAPCDLATARIISREVSDGIIAPGYSPEALEVLKKKKAGKYCVLEVRSLDREENTCTRTAFLLTFYEKKDGSVVHAPGGRNAPSLWREPPAAQERC